MRKPIRKSLFALTLAWLAQGCSPQTATIIAISPTPSPTVSAATELPASCFVSGTTRPASLCGQAGYNFLLQIYVRPQCGGCHYSGSSIHFNAFADPDDSTAYTWGRLISPASWTERVTDNPFLYPECHLKIGDSIYMDLQSWLTCQ